jgi:hypothetical protein
MAEQGQRVTDMKTLQKSSAAMLLVAGALFMAGYASAGADIVIDAAPPAPRAEHEPPHRDGYVWAPGYWEWNGRFFHWTSGTWISERRGHWVADHWDQVGNQWRYVQGQWEP